VKAPINVNPSRHGFQVPGERFLGILMGRHGDRSYALDEVPIRPAWGICVGRIADLDLTHIFSIVPCHLAWQEREFAGLERECRSSTSLCRLVRQERMFVASPRSLFTCRTRRQGSCPLLAFDFFSFSN
jgi:hypothetical protein